MLTFPTVFDVYPESLPPNQPPLRTCIPLAHPFSAPAITITQLLQERRTRHAADATNFSTEAPAPPVSKSDKSESKGSALIPARIRTLTPRHTHTHAKRGPSLGSKSKGGGGDGAGDLCLMLSGVYACRESVCVCVCVREREREERSLLLYIAPLGHGNLLQVS